MSSLVRISRALSRECSALHFAPPVAFVYNPLEYAREVHEAYLRRFATVPCEVLLLGMNPGPFGMVQTGVPFGEVGFVRDWLQLDGRVERPEREHPKRRVEGLACTRSEVSGARLWGWVSERFGTPEAFFARFFVWNHCPLAFLEESGRNRTPDKLPAAEQAPLFTVCDTALAAVVRALRPRLVVGVGAFAESRARLVLGDRVRIGRILHPSPASPLANQGWSARAERQFAELGVELP
ncbi:MAG: single-stranded DNA-binding protein [Planctomycetes bacterium]|nr:single-stranded DNA-binding protein [Planctomycetota bacterium]